MNTGIPRSQNDGVYDTIAQAQSNGGSLAEGHQIRIKNPQTSASVVTNVTSYPIDGTLLFIQLDTGDTPVTNPQTTTQGLILSTSFSGEPVGYAIKTTGYSSVFDGGAASWSKTSESSTPSLDPYFDSGSVKLSDGSGSVWILDTSCKQITPNSVSPCDTTSSMNLAIDICYSLVNSDTSVKVLLIGNYEITTEKVATANRFRIESLVSSKILPKANIRSALRFEGSNQKVSKIFFEQTGILSGAQSAISVNKGFDNSTFSASEIEATNFESCLSWEGGDRPILDNFRTVNCFTALNFLDNGMNGQISKINTLGGAGLKINSTTQQMEGTHFSGLNFLVGNKTEGNRDTDIGVLISSGLHLTFDGLVIDQCYNASALKISPSVGNDIAEIEISKIWCGANGSSISGLNGIDIDGGVNEVSMVQGRLSGWKNYGVRIVGQSESVKANNVNLNNVTVKNSGVADLLSANANGSLMLCNFDTTTNGIWIQNTSTFSGFGNNLATGPQNLGLNPQFIASRGAGASLGIPTSNSGLSAGGLWSNSGDVNVVT